MAAEQKLTPIPELSTSGSWDSLLRGEQKQALETQLPGILITRRWFGAKGRVITSTAIVDSVPVEHGSETSYFSLVEVRYASGEPDVYVLAISHATGERAREILADGRSGFAIVRTRDGEVLLYDAAHDPAFAKSMLDMICEEQKHAGEQVAIEGVRTAAVPELHRDSTPTLVPKVMRAEQSNTSIVFGDKQILKLFRRLQEGTNPDFEIGRFLTEHGFRNTPATQGALQLRRQGAEPTTTAILQTFVANRGDAWKYTIESLEQMVRRAEANVHISALSTADSSLLELTNQQPPQELTNVASDYLQSARLLGRRTAEMHLVLADGKAAAFVPEPFSPAYQQELYRSMDALAAGAFDLLQRNLSSISGEALVQASDLLQRKDELREELRAVQECRIESNRIRIHGDYHLGQVLFTGEDFMIIDFEGEPMRGVEERRMKKSPLQDVAGMLRSFDYSAWSVLQSGAALGDGQLVSARESLLQAWRRWTSAAFLSSYLKTCGEASFLPKDRAQLEVLLNAFLLEKAAYELLYEINNRPAWVGIPIAGILRTLEARRAGARYIRTA